MNKRVLALLLVVVMVFTLAACNGGNAPTTTTTAGADQPTTSGEQSSSSEAEVKTGTYTYNEAWSVGPTNWNPHSWEMSNDSAFMGYINSDMAFSDIKPGAKEGETQWMWRYEALTGIKDVTAEFADKEKFGIPADAKERYVYELKLNELMKWDTGESINADDYIYSMQMLLDPSMKNYRSNSFTTGEAELRNAKGYFENDKANKPIYAAVSGAGEEMPADAKQYVTFKNEVVFFGGKAEDAYNKDDASKEKFMVNGVDVFEKYKDQEYIELNDEIKAEITAISVAFGDENPDAYLEWLVYDTGEIFPETPWDKVGLVKVDDYTLLYILERPLEEFYMHYSLGGNWLVHKETYEKNFETINNLKASKYGTTLETTRSNGPYKLVSFEKDKQFVLERNEHWLGYHDGNHEGEFAPDRIVVNIVESAPTRKQLFMQGKIDALGLQADEIVTFRKSDKLYLTDQTYTLRYIFATSDEALKARDAEKGSGRRIVMKYKDFRKALSLAIDRDKFCKEATSAFKPAYFLFNKLYFYDIANDPNSVYRNSKYAKKAILDLYGAEYTDETIDAEYAKITGRDVEDAKKFFQTAYEQAVADGNYTDGEEVPIEIMVTPTELTPQHIKQQQLMQSFFDEASMGTPFEGKIKVVYESGDKKRYDNVALGKNMAIAGAWGGAAFYPFSTIRVYTNPTYMGGLGKIHESNGWDPSKEQLTLKIKKADGTEVEETMTFEEWSNTINGEGKYTYDPIERLQVFAGLENGVLSTYQNIPLGTYTAAELISYKVAYATENYNIMYGFGGLRHLKMLMNDEEWDKFVQENNGQLNYE